MRFADALELEMKAWPLRDGWFAGAPRYATDPKPLSGGRFYSVDEAPRTVTKYPVSADRWASRKTRMKAARKNKAADMRSTRARMSVGRGDGTDSFARAQARTAVAMSREVGASLASQGLGVRPMSARGLSARARRLAKRK